MKVNVPLSFKAFGYSALFEHGEGGSHVKPTSKEASQVAPSASQPCRVVAHVWRPQIVHFSPHGGDLVIFASLL